MIDSLFESWVRAVTAGEEMQTFCLMCLRSYKDRILVSSEGYWRVLARLKVPPGEDLSPVKEQRLCRECGAMLRRCGLVLDAALQAYRLHTLTQSQAPQLTSQGLYIVHPDVVKEVSGLRRRMRAVLKLSVTETLVVSGGETPPPAPAPAPAPPPHHTNMLGNNIILVPAYSNQVLQMSGGGGMQLMQLVQPVNTLQVVTQPQPHQYQLLDTNTHKQTPASNNTHRQTQVVVSESSHAPAAPRPAVVTEDQHTIAFIETDIASDGFGETQEWITPDLDKTRPTGPSRKRNKSILESALLTRTDPEPKPVRVFAAAEVVELSDSDEEEKSVPARPAPPPAAPWRPGGGEVDWENEIPTEVISAEPVHNKRKTGGGVSGMGRILCVRSHADSWSATDETPARHKH